MQRLQTADDYDRAAGEALLVALALVLLFGMVAIGAVTLALSIA